MLLEVVGFEGYRLSSNGDIFSFKRYRNGKLISPYTDKDGYLCISLRVNGSSKAEKVHRAVAKAFIPNPDNLPQVNHKDGNKKNNNVENLEWVSNIQNQRHAWNNNLKTIKLTVEKVSQIKAYIKGGLRNIDISKIYNIDPSLVSNIRHNKIWKDAKSKQ
jgi:hypothetical protein